MLRVRTWAAPRTVAFVAAVGSLFLSCETSAPVDSDVSATPPQFVQENPSTTTLSAVMDGRLDPNVIVRSADPPVNEKSMSSPLFSEKTAQSWLPEPRGETREFKIEVVLAEPLEL